MNKKEEYVTRIHLKREKSDVRKELINKCLNSDSENQFLALGWSNIYGDDKEKEINSYEDFYKLAKKEGEKTNPALNVFCDAKKNDLFWTRDLDGIYWICRVKEKARNHLDKRLDIGASLAVEAYKVGIDVPGAIKASFNRPQGGTVHKIRDKQIIEYSKYVYNLKSETCQYKYEKKEGELLDNLPDFELEELVISYLQLKENYYVLSNSIANKSTTIKIECELITREIAKEGSKPQRAVVQVKGGKTGIKVEDYKTYLERGYMVYLYAAEIEYIDNLENIIEITRKDLKEFYKEYERNLPESITRWKELIKE